MRRYAFLLSLLTAVALPSFAEGPADAALLHELPTATLSLQQGLEAAATHGKPISGKFELEDGKLQLSVYTTKAGKYAEVIVDHMTGKVVKAEPIKAGEDLAHAKSQAALLARSKSTLKSAADYAERANPGFHVVSIVPSGEPAHATAAVILAKGEQSRQVSAALK